MADGAVRSLFEALVERLMRKSFVDISWILLYTHLGNPSNIYTHQNKSNISRISCHLVYWELESACLGVFLLNDEIISTWKW
jgi:hypothetical protein